MKRIGMLACGLALAACASANTPVVQPSENLPDDYRQQIIVEVKKAFFDPYTIRDAGISQPISGQSFQGPVTSICVRANAKNRMGAYTGIKPTAFTFRGKRLTVTDTQNADITCIGAGYEPFPEIEEGYKPAPPPRGRRATRAGFT